MARARFKIDIKKALNKTLSDFNYEAGVDTRKDKRKEVLHNKTSLLTVSRGLANKKSQKKSSVKNTDIIADFYNDYNFRLYEIAFSPKNPNYKIWVRSVKYIFNEDPKRFENAVVANIKATLDKQKVHKNSKKTALVKKFNKFGIDSRQLQMSFAANRK